jgi:hypothetical protein
LIELVFKKALWLPKLKARKEVVKRLE